jgi:hypothetical protein
MTQHEAGVKSQVEHLTRRRNELQSLLGDYQMERVATDARHTRLLLDAPMTDDLQATLQQAHEAQERNQQLARLMVDAKQVLDRVEGKLKEARDAYQHARRQRDETELYAETRARMEGNPGQNEHTVEMTVKREINARRAAEIQRPPVVIPGSAA